MNRRRSQRGGSSRDQVPGGRSADLTGLDRLPRPVRLDDERDELRVLLGPRPAVEAVYPWASPRASRGLRSYPPSPPAKRAVGASKLWRYSPLRVLQMSAPASTRFCVMRKQRREVLFAFRRAGYRGSARKRSWRRTGDSQYRC